MKHKTNSSREEISKRKDNEKYFELTSEKKINDFENINSGIENYIQGLLND